MRRPSQPSRKLSHHALITLRASGRSSASMTSVSKSTSKTTTYPPVGHAHHLRERLPGIGNVHQAAIGTATVETIRIKRQMEDIPT